MGVEDEYRKHAERCRLMAENSPKAADRAFWLLLAENWQSLAQKTEASDAREEGSEASLAPSVGALRRAAQGPRQRQSATHMFAFGGKADMTIYGMSAFSVAFGGKADMAYCSAHVRL